MALLAPAITITFPAPPSVSSPPPPLLLLLLHERPFAAGMPSPPRRRRRLCELDSSRGLLAGSLETAAPRRALAGAHIRNSGTAAKSTRGKGLGHVIGIYRAVWSVLQQRPRGGP